MVNIIVKKHSNGNRNEGMVAAGTEIRSLLTGIAAEQNPGQQQQLARDFFGNLWNSLDAGYDGDAGDPTNDFFMIGEDGDEWPMERESANGKFYSEEKYFDQNQVEQKAEVEFDPSGILDKLESEGPGNKKPKKRKMSISVPASGNTGYLDRVVDDISDIGLADRAKVKDYLLAVIFLNRCQ